MRPAQHFTAFCACARDVGMVGENPTFSVPELWDAKIYGHMATAMNEMSTPLLQARTNPIFRAHMSFACIPPSFFVRRPYSAVKVKMLQLLTYVLARTPVSACCAAVLSRLPLPRLHRVQSPFLSRPPVLQRTEPAPQPQPHRPRPPSLLAGGLPNRPSMLLPLPAGCLADQ